MELAQKLFSTRGGTLLLAALAAVVAAVAVVVYVKHYRSSVKSNDVPATVLVASKLIPKGTAGTIVGSEHLFQATQIRQNQLKVGALSDPGSLTGRVAVVDIYPGQQLTDADFVLSGGSVATNLVGDQRAIEIPIDSTHGLIGFVNPGDKVDIYVSFNLVPIDSSGKPTGGSGRQVLRLLAPAVPVIGVIGGATKTGLGGQSASSTSVLLRAGPVLASKLAFSSDNGKLWLVLRPPTGGKTTPPNLVTVETVMLGVPPIAALKSFGATAK